MNQKFSTLLLTTICCCSCTILLSGCFKNWTFEEVHGWYEKQPQNWDEWMASANEAMQSGDADKALDRYQHALDLAEAEFGPNDLRVATSATAFGAFQKKRFKYIEAEALYKKALEVETKTLKADNPEVVQTKKDLADVLNKEFKPDEAKKILGGIKLEPASAVHGGKSGHKKRSH